MFAAKKLITLKQISRPILTRFCCFHEEFNNSHPFNKKTVKTNQDQIPGAVKDKYKIFRDEDSFEIFDVEEEKQKQFHENDMLTETKEFMDINLKRGLNGVFEIEDLVDVLRKENADEIIVCSVPKEFKYVDYMCIVTARSYRHMIAIAEFVRRIYKMKRESGDIIPKIEGDKSRDWMALDMGNIALHIFSAKTRRLYDLESLWSIGPEYDKECNKPEDPLVEVFEKHSIFLRDLKPETNQTV